MTEKISVIIAAKNEAPRIGKVLDVVCGHPLVEEVIVVCNGSTDGTIEIARKYDVVLLDKGKAMGKTLAVEHGLKHARSEIVMLLDADLKGLTKQNITDLAAPVISKEVDFTLSIRKNSYRFYKWMGIDFVSGERVMRKELLKDKLIWSKPHVIFSLEVLMNKSLLDRKCTFLAVYLPNLYCTPKSEKHGFIKGTIEDILMDIDILFSQSPFEVLRQLIVMAFLARKYRKQINEKEKVLA